MTETRVFMLNGMQVQDIVTRLEGFFRTEKGMDVQSSQTTDGYVMQASQPKDGWKTLTGMRLAVTVQMAVAGDQLNVSIGEGQWSDKIGAGAIGLFVAWPLAITAGMGAYKQKKLPSEVFQVIENTIMTGGTAGGGVRRRSDRGRTDDAVPELQGAACPRLEVLQPLRSKARTKMPELRRRNHRRQRLLLRMRSEAIRHKYRKPLSLNYTFVKQRPPSVTYIIEGGTLFVFAFQADLPPSGSEFIMAAASGLITQ